MRHEQGQDKSDEEVDLACEEEIADIEAQVQMGGPRKYEILYNKNYLEEINKIGHQRHQSQNIIGFEKRFNEKGTKSRNYFQSSLAGKGDLPTVAEEATQTASKSEISYIQKSGVHS